MTGHEALLVTTPDGSKNGINLDTDTLFEECTDVNVVRTGIETSINFINPASGIYQITITGTLPDRVPISMNFLNSEIQDEWEAAVYFNGSATIFSVQIDPTNTPVFSLVTKQPPPYDLTALNQGGMTLLRWKAPVTGNPASYKIYSRQAIEPFFTLLTSVDGTNTTYLTSHSIESPERLYVISAVDDQGNESILTRVVNNHIQSEYMLNVAGFGMGSGKITSTVSGIDCGDDCSEYYLPGTTVTLTATPLAGSNFKRWIGTDCSGTDTCTVTMDQPRAVLAEFTKAFPWPMFLPALTGAGK